MPNEELDGGSAIVSIAAIKAASDPKTVTAAADYDERIAAGRPYEDAEDVADLLSEAVKRYF